MSSLIAAVTHDLDHPGVNQPFLIATSNHLAALYEVQLCQEISHSGMNQQTGKTNCYLVSKGHTVV
jgi:hypothetical protein